MNPASVFKIITNSTWIVTQLLGESSVQFGQKHYRLSVSEATEPGPLLQLTVNVRSKDVVLHFEISSGNEIGLFRVDASSGLLSLLQPLDYETATKHELVVEASFLEDSSKAQVLVEVLDANEYIPTFQRTRYETQITEEDDRDLPKSILNVMATDSDQGRFGRVVYSLESSDSSGATENHFQIDAQTGDLLLLRPLDREGPMGRSRWEFSVVASDGEFVTSSDVIVNVRDVNDHAPFFPDVIMETFVSENQPEGTFVTTVRALDLDDGSEGGNAVVLYSVQKNAVEASSGRPIFSVDRRSGRLSTALACLDRERTPSYHLQIVATDGGGLKGTGTVIVNIVDVNDVPPKFSRREWFLDVKEEVPPGHELASLSVIDPDVSNHWRYRVVSGRGRGWDYFQIVAGNETGSHLYSEITFDYENPEHRKGFRIQVQVSDVDEDGWEDKYHLDSAWVNVQILDINDNSPMFLTRTHYRRVAEDLPVGTSLGTLKAIDVDGGGNSSLDYAIDMDSDPKGLFRVDKTGSVRLKKPLDRETSEFHRLLVLAMDHELPIRTASATFTVSVSDVNDNPPFFDCPTLVSIDEGSSPHVIANLTLGDPDDWTKGHGPPFALFMDPRAPSYIRRAVTVEFQSGVNGGVGVGVLRTVSRLDREERRHLLVPIVVSDAAGTSQRQSATLTFTVALRDLNDNKMVSASKHVMVRLIQVSPQSSTSSNKGRAPSKVPLGRVFVIDPDDEDVKDKKFQWREPNPFFQLDVQSGHLFMEPWAPSGRYILQFLVSDAKHAQSNIPANVTVDVKTLTSAAITTSVPIDLEDETIFLLQQNQLTTREFPLHALARVIDEWIQRASLDEPNRASYLPQSSQSNEKESDNGVSIVALQSLDGLSGTKNEEKEKEKKKEKKDESRMWKTPRSRLWVSSPTSVNLQHVLLHRIEEMEKMLSVKVSKIGSGECAESQKCASGCWVRPEIVEGYALVDAEAASFVGPKLRLISGCGCQPPTVESNGKEDPYMPRPVVKETTHGGCGEGSCLNGGRCAPKDGALRCICPHDTEGSRCTIAQRFFYGDETDHEPGRTKKHTVGHKGLSLPSRDEEVDTVGNRKPSWAWLPSLPSCSEVHLSLEFLTEKRDGVLLFSGETIPPVTLKFTPQFPTESIPQDSMKPNSQSSMETTFAERLRKEKSLRRRKKRNTYRDSITKLVYGKTRKDNFVISSFLLDQNENKKMSRLGTKTQNHFWSLNRINETETAVDIILPNSSQQSIHLRDNRLLIHRAESWKIQHSKRSGEVFPQKFSINRTIDSRASLNLKDRTRRISQILDISRTLSNEKIIHHRNYRKELTIENESVIMLEQISPSIDVKVTETSDKNNFTNKNMTTMKFVPSHYRNTSPGSQSGDSKKVSKFRLSKRKRSTVRKDLPNVSRDVVKEFILLRLVDGKPHLTVNFGDKDITLSLSASSTSLSDLKWHRIDVIWRDQLVELIVDLCSGKSIDVLSQPPPPSDNFVPYANPPDAPQCRVAAPLSEGSHTFNFGGPVQVGGIAHQSLKSGMTYSNFFPTSFNGCVRNVRVNGEDLGYGILGSRSVPGCLKMGCGDTLKCSEKGKCFGSPGEERCECIPGWTGVNCQDRTVPVTFGEQSFASLALSFTPFSLATTIQLRFRTRRESGELMSLSSLDGKDGLSLLLRGGSVCLRLRLHPEEPSLLCLTKVQLHDGQWHTLKAIRVGSSLILTADEGESSELYNASIRLGGRTLLSLSSQEGINVGGTPEHREGKLLTVRSDFSRGCIDDLRVQGRSLPLPPRSMKSEWGEVTGHHHVTEGCHSSPSCLNVSCTFPLSCIDSWELYHCGCEEGLTLSSEGDACEDIDECSWKPCLYGGVCHNDLPGYSCSCPSGYYGDHCHLKEEVKTDISSSLPGFIAVALSCLLLVFVFFGLAYFRRRNRRRKMTPVVKEVDDVIEFRSGVCGSGILTSGGVRDITHMPDSIDTISLRIASANNTNISGVDVLKVDIGERSSSVCGCSFDSPSIKKKGLDPALHHWQKETKDSSSSLDVINTYHDDL